MKTISFVVCAVLTAHVALAQVPQGLGAADPSQQIKSAGMDPTMPGFSLGAPIIPEESHDPLITVIESKPRASRAQSRAHVRAAQRARTRRRAERADRVTIIDER